MNILFIVPLNEPYNTIIGANKAAVRTKLNLSKNIKKLYCVYPSGVLSIAAYAKNHIPDLNVKILDLNVIINQLALKNLHDLNGYSFQDFLEEAFLMLDGFVPDVIGISALFSSVYQDLKPLASILRRRFSDSMIICGGHLPTTLYERIYADDIDIDAVVFGEGELPFVELLRALKSGQKDEYVCTSPSWITKPKLQEDRSFVPRNNVIFDLDEIPPYNLADLLVQDAYYESSTFLFMPELAEKHREMIMYSTRGCPYNCVFCASHQVHGKKVRFYSAERVKKDFEYYHDNYGIDKFAFYDDHFLIQKERAISILNFISDMKLIAAIINPAFFSIDADIAFAMKQAGVKSVIISIESGNENTFKNIIHKPSSLKKASEAVDILHKVGINAATNFMIGLPGETKESIDAGLTYLLTTSLNWYLCFVAAPLPGSELFEICKQNGYFITNDDILLMDFKKCVIKTNEFSPDYIERKVYEMNLKLNFVNNYDIRVGNYENALMLFEKVINTVIDTHAFAYYFAAVCCRQLKRIEKYNAYKAAYENLLAKYPFWQEYALQFNLSKLD